MAGFFLTLDLLETMLLRIRSNDVMVWRVMQGCISVLDVVMVYAAVKMLVAEGRWRDVGGWRGDDWRLVAGNVGMGVVRVGCALGWGMGGWRQGRGTS